MTKVLRREEKERVTEVLDGGVDDVAAVEEEADEPRPDKAAAARHADESTTGTTAVSGRRRCHLVGSLSVGLVIWSAALGFSHKV